MRIVAASPDANIMAKGGLGGRTIIVASEYEQLTRRWLEKRGVPFTFLRAYGATESLPPEDADVIVDNAATGATLKANQLEVFDSLLNSTTRLYASKAAWADPAKRARIEELAVLLRSVLDARKRALITFNCSVERLESILAFLPACVIWRRAVSRRAASRRRRRLREPQRAMRNHPLSHSLAHPPTPVSPPQHEEADRLQAVGGRGLRRADGRRGDASANPHPAHPRGRGYRPRRASHPHARRVNGQAPTHALPLIF